MLDLELEREIDEAGREEVFARARALGWEGPVEKWIWRSIIDDIKAGRHTPTGAPPRRLDEALLGFRLF